MIETGVDGTRAVRAGILTGEDRNDFSHIVLNVWAAVSGEMIFKSAQTTVVLRLKSLLVTIIVPVTAFLVTISLVTIIPVHVTVTVTLVETLIIWVSIKATPSLTVTLVTTVHGRVFCIEGLSLMTLLIILSFAV
jgi:hypothetical protein